MGNRFDNNRTTKSTTNFHETSSNRSQYKTNSSSLIGKGIG